MSSNRLVYLPLGGAGEIGMNCYVYGYGPAGKERLILVDLGVAFPDMDTSPGVDLILPDINWLMDKLDRLEAIFITHAHEDHIGAVPHLWPLLRCPSGARRRSPAALTSSSDSGRCSTTTGAPLSPCGRWRCRRASRPPTCRTPCWSSIRNGSAVWPTS